MCVHSARSRFSSITHNLTYSGVFLIGFFFDAIRRCVYNIVVVIDMKNNNFDGSVPRDVLLRNPHRIAVDLSHNSNLHGTVGIPDWFDASRKFLFPGRDGRVFTWKSIGVTGTNITLVNESY